MNILLLVVALLSAQPSCPDSAPWADEDAGLPEAVLKAHYPMPPAETAAMLVETGRGDAHWLGLSYRSDSDDCWLAGSAAFYYNGPEPAPRLDVVKAILEGREPWLRTELLELRWFEGGKRRRWVNRAMLNRLGWLESPLPYSGASNTLY